MNNLGTKKEKRLSTKSAPKSPHSKPDSAVAFDQNTVHSYLHQRADQGGDHMATHEQDWKYKLLVSSSRDLMTAFQQTHTKAPTLSCRKLPSNSKLWSSRSWRLRQTCSHCWPTALPLHCLFNSALPKTNKTAFKPLLTSTPRSKSTIFLFGAEVRLYVCPANDEEALLECNIYDRIKCIFCLS